MLNIKDLRPFMFNDNNIRKILNTKKCIKKTDNIQIKKEVKKSGDSTNEKVFRTSENCDPLIWYYNILLNGMQSYHFLGNNAYQEENKMKMELVYKIRDNKQLLKNMMLVWSRITKIVKFFIILIVVQA